MIIENPTERLYRSRIRRSFQDGNDKAVIQIGEVSQSPADSIIGKRLAGTEGKAQKRSFTDYEEANQWVLENRAIPLPSQSRPDIQFFNHRDLKSILPFFPMGFYCSAAYKAAPR